jgi:hypothetical protein
LGNVVSDTGNERLPAADLRHCTLGRLRLRFPEKAGDLEWFADLEKALVDSGGFSDVSANPRTGSVLLCGDSVEPSKVSSLGRDLKLFNYEHEPFEMSPLADKAVEPLAAFNRELKHFTNSELNLPTVIFIGLLVNALYQVVRGRMTPLPWYSALWYAFGLYSKNLIT